MLVITYGFMKDIKKEFNRQHPKYKDQLEVTSRCDKQVSLTLNGINHIATVAKLCYKQTLDNCSDDEIVWLNLTNIFDNLVSIYERDHLDEELKTLNEQIESELSQIAKDTDMDMNTLWLAFQSGIYELEEKIKHNYINVS